MKQDLTELVYILDMSGSMSSLRNDTIGGYNTMLADQKSEDGEANVTTVLFDDRYIVLHDRINLKDVQNITEKEYSPCGMTALLDACGKTIHSVGEKLAALPEEERPGGVIVTIITDGYENASKEYTWDVIKKMITEQKEKYSWIFTFIGANIDTMEVSQNLGIDACMAKSYTASAKGTASVYASVSAANKKVRKMSASASMDAVYCAMEEDLGNIK